jgi:hypothetical protein
VPPPVRVNTVAIVSQQSKTFSEGTGPTYILETEHGAVLWRVASVDTDVIVVGNNEDLIHPCITVLPTDRPSRPCIPGALRSQEAISRFDEERAGDLVRKT